MKRFEHFDSVTARSLDYTAAKYGVVLSDVSRKRLLDGWKTLAPHPEVESVFTQLKEREASVMILTNGVRESVRTALEHSGISHLVDRVWTVEAVRVYKPDPAVYNQVTSSMNVEPHEISFVSSNGWDATGASEFGFVTIWCNRKGLPAETLGMPPSLTITNLSQLLDLP
jgi:2-haloacid dehalogenase